MKKLTDEQNRCLGIVRDRGCIVRYPGGFWQRPHAICDTGAGNPIDAVGTGTITALVNRDYLSVAQYKNGPRGRFPVTAIFTKRGEKYLPPKGDGKAFRQLGLFDD
jgi:hypothetical protein